MEAIKVDRPVQFPGTDIHGYQHGPMVDMCVNIVPGRAGRVYLGEGAVKLAARALGFPSPEAYAKLEAERDGLLEQVVVLEAQLREAEAGKVVSLADALELAKTSAPAPTAA